jgi:carbonic anhydrase
MRTGVLSVAPLAVVSGCRSSDETHEARWSYSGDTGPEHWSQLSPDYAAASSGHAQSPIDISNVAVTETHDLEFHYKPTHVVMVNNGHTIEVEYEGGSSMRFDGSLTTPPCPEGVRWLVMQEPIPLDHQQIDRFRSLYHGNNRHIQPLYGRTVVSE